MGAQAADFVSEFYFTRHVQRFGFHAYLATAEPEAPTNRASVFLSAIRWKAEQPRLVLKPWDEGYADWRRLLDESDEDRGSVKFVGSAAAAHTLEDQWCTHAVWSNVT